MPEDVGRSKAERDFLAVLDLSIGIAARGAAASVAVGRGLRSRSRPVVHVLLRPPVVTARLQPATWLGGVAHRGALRRAVVKQRSADLLDLLVPAIVAALVRRVDLTKLVAENVDLDSLILQADLDTAARRLDVDAIARRLDIDEVIGRLDLTEIVKRGVDLDGLVATVDIDAAAARLDLEAILARVDLVGVAREVIAEIDLPEIIRESTGSMASDTMRGVRMQSISGDDALGRIIDRVRQHRAHRDAGSAPNPQQVAANEDSRGARATTSDVTPTVV
jgi:hypothetical protein